MPQEPWQSSHSKKAEQLAAVLERHRGEKHIIVLQDFPDPDAISSALAHQAIAARFEIECDIGYAGVISHHENVALVELLKINLLRIKPEFDFSTYSGCVFVDSQGTTSTLTNRLAAARLPIVAVVDHHEPQGTIETDFVDIRPGASATASIFAEYLEAGLIRLERSNADHVRLATALMHGIRSETSGLLYAKKEDFTAAAFLADSADLDSLSAILSHRRSRAVMDVIRTALESRVLRDNYSVAGVGYLRSEDRDAIPQAADFLLTGEYVHNAIVYGLVLREGGGESIVGSLRTHKPTLNPDTFLKDALGLAETGRYYGGGRRQAGGFEIPIGFLASNPDEEFQRRKWRLYDEQIKRKIWAKLGLQELRPAGSE